MKTGVHCKSHLYQQHSMFVSAETIRTKLSSMSVDLMLIYDFTGFFVFVFATDAASDHHAIVSHTISQ